MARPSKYIAKGISPGSGRHTEFTNEIAEYICERISDGESLKAICEEDGMPRKATVFRWLAEPQNGAFRDMYTRAREVQADVLADSILHIADNPMIGEKIKETDDGKREVVTADMIEHRKLQIDARKWIASKLKPRVYGANVEEVPQASGPIGKIEIEVVSAKPRD